MLFFRKELKKKYNSTYKLNKALENKEIFKVQFGLYSDKEYVGTLEIISKKDPDAILTNDSAFYYLDLTDVIPDVYYVATSRNHTRIHDKNIIQVFIPKEVLELGKKRTKIENANVYIYDKERMLIELVKKKKKIPFDYYKEIIANYRSQADKLDTHKIQEYISFYSNKDSLLDTIQREIF